MIRAAIVGMGWWGRTLVEAVQGVSQDVKFVGGVSRSQSDDHRQLYSQHHLTLCQTYEQALADPDVDAVVLATPHSLHTSQVIAAAQAKKHVFCEKPFALKKSDAEAAVSATVKAGVTLGLGYNRRFHPEMTNLRQQIRSGELGTILHVEGQ
jgi:predicted dehydrogenase